MKQEVLRIRDLKISYEVYEAELKISRSDTDPIKVITFDFKELPSQVLEEVAPQLWGEVARKYLDYKKICSSKSNREVIGRISFECDRARVEYEFSRLTESALNHLELIGRFVKQYPESEEIRISRDGPTLVRFGKSTLNELPLTSPEPNIRSRLKSWLVGLGRSLAVLRQRAR